MYKYTYIHIYVYIYKDTTKVDRLLLITYQHQLYILLSYLFM